MRVGLDFLIRAGYYRPSRFLLFAFRRLPWTANVACWEIGFSSKSGDESRRECVVHRASVRDWSPQPGQLPRTRDLFPFSLVFRQCPVINCSFAL